MRPNLLVVAMLLPAAAASAADLTVAGYSSSVDTVAQTATFAIDYTVWPRYRKTNQQGLARDSFALWIDPDAPDAYERAQQHYFGELPGSQQTFVTADSVAQTGQLQASSVVDSTTYTGPFGVDGWGPAVGSFAYALSQKAVTFTLPLSLLGATDGHFYYSLQFTRYGATEGGPFEGTSGVAYTAPFPTMSVPEPATEALIATGLVALLGFGRRQAPLPAS